MRRKEQVTPFQHQWIELDTSVVHFGVEESNRWETVAASQVDDTPAIVADVVGCSCQLDLMVSGATLPDLAPGDIVAFPDSGAYQETGGSNFNALGRPAVVLIRGADAEVVKRRESIDDVLARDTVPQRLVAGGAS
ncbi:MAG: hypothetical protein R2715_11985 [Ilumatobacteraceae bacterium]